MDYLEATTALVKEDPQVRRNFQTKMAGAGANVDDTLLTMTQGNYKREVRATILALENMLTHDEVVGLCRKYNLDTMGELEPSALSKLMVEAITLSADISRRRAANESNAKMERLASEMQETLKVTKTIANSIAFIRDQARSPEPAPVPVVKETVPSGARLDRQIANLLRFVQFVLPGKTGDRVVKAGGIDRLLEVPGALSSWLLDSDLGGYKALVASYVNLRKKHESTSS